MSQALARQLGKTLRLRVASNLVSPSASYHEKILRGRTGFRRRRSYIREEHTPHLSMFREDESQSFVPLAIKKGRPFHDEYNPVPQGFDAQKDIWIVRDAQSIHTWEPDDWEPPTRDDDDVLALLDSLPYKTYSLTFDFVNNNPQLGARNVKPTPDYYSRLGGKKKVEEFFQFIGVDAHTEFFRAQYYLNLLIAYTYAKGKVWKNGAGSHAMNEFFKAAAIVCLFHASNIGKACPQVYSYHLGGSGENNGGNLKFASRTVHDESKLRDTSMWMEPKDQNATKTQLDPTRHWAYSFRVPDSLLAVYDDSGADPPFSPIGMIVGKVASDERYQENAEQAFTQALEGLYYSPFTAALLMSPEVALFQSIRVDNGFVHTEMKTYLQYPSFKTLFTDLVLYLWDSYFKDHKRLNTDRNT